MKKSKFTDSQIVSALKPAEAGTPVPDLCREHGISSATFYTWRAQCDGGRPDMAQGAVHSGRRLTLRTARVGF
jgi:putative transposase